MFFMLRYAGKSIQFARGKNAIEVPDLDKLPGIIDCIMVDQSVIIARVRFIREWIATLSNHQLAVL